MKIAIIGAGNAGCAHAFKFAEAGHVVNLIKTSHAMHDENFNQMVFQGGLWAVDHTNNDLKSFQSLNLITRDITSGLQGCEAILIMTQSLQHTEISKRISGYVSDSVKLVLVLPGNLGSVYFRNLIKNENIIIGEGESTPFDARIIEPGVVNILFRNVRNKLAFYPSSDSEAGMALAKQIHVDYDTFRLNVIESALHNPNLVVHTIGVIMSAARIEYTNGEFWMYREGFTPAIWNLVDALDAEKNAVITAFGGIPSRYIDECKYRNERDLSRDSLEVFNSYGNDGGPKGPKTIHSRYLYEDVPKGLCLLKDLGLKAGVPTPVCYSLINIASCLVNRDFLNSDKTIVEIGWEGLDQSSIMAKL